MLEMLLRYLNNWFVYEVHHQTFKIADGGITLPFLQDGQLFRICGSVFNDGLHKYPATDLKDEIFSGVVDALAVPQAVQDLAGEMEVWQSKYGDATDSPYSSEAFGGYSYTKAVAGDGGKVNVWGAFAERLSQWRKI